MPEQENVESPVSSKGINPQEASPMFEEPSMPTQEEIDAREREGSENKYDASISSQVDMLNVEWFQEIDAFESEATSPPCKSNFPDLPSFYNAVTERNLRYQINRRKRHHGRSKFRLKKKCPVATTPLLYAAPELDFAVIISNYDLAVDTTDPYFLEERRMEVQRSFTSILPFLGVC